MPTRVKGHQHLSRVSKTGPTLLLPRASWPEGSRARPTQSPRPAQWPPLALCPVLPWQLKLLLGSSWVAPGVWKDRALLALPDPAVERGLPQEAPRPILRTHVPAPTAAWKPRWLPAASGH